MLTEEKFLALAKKKYAQINSLLDHPNMLDYERGLRELMNEMACSIMEEQVGGQTNDRRKKRRSSPLSEK